MSEKYKIYPDGIFFITMTVVGWIDVFTRREYCDIIIKNLNYCIDNKGLEVFAYCIMPSHIHMVASAGEGSLSNILHDFKSYTSKQITQAIEANPQESRKEWLRYMFQYFAKGSSHDQQLQFWQSGNHPIDLHSHHLFQQKVDYIHQNPVVAGYVNEAENYMYTSANPLNSLKLKVH